VPHKVLPITGGKDSFPVQFTSRQNEMNFEKKLKYHGFDRSKSKNKS
jgi:hypothetical protein